MKTGSVINELVGKTVIDGYGHWQITDSRHPSLRRVVTFHLNGWRSDMKYRGGKPGQANTAGRIPTCGVYYRNKCRKGQNTQLHCYTA
jgi:hypothetical protein